MAERLIIDYSSPGREGYSLPPLEVPDLDMEEQLGKDYLRQDLKFPEVSEVDVVRHYTALSELNYGVDSGIYPLGSCTMKYNPKRNEDIARIEGLANLHPYQDEKDVQGSLKFLFELKQDLAEISGMDEMTLQPASGAHGEFTGLLIIRKYFEDKGIEKSKVIVPDSAHGTNPASATMAGFEIVEIDSNEEGMVDIEKLKEAVDDDVAALMLTNPNTLGIFEKDIQQIADIIHDVGGLLYYDGANLNAVMGYARPGDMDFDVLHLNLHKTFSTPHGGGGPGSGTVGVKEFLKPYLPRPVLDKEDDKYFWDYNRPKSIGKVHGFYGNYGVLIRAYSYIKTLGGRGLKKKEKGGDTLHIAKRLLDYGQYAPTIYFPLVVKEAMMIEPTETENLETLNKFINTLKTISKEVEENPELVKNAPHNTSVRKLDEVKAAREPDLGWQN